MTKKYEMTSDTRKLIDGREVHRIKALRDFGKVKRGDVGGWIEKEENLSHEGNCWIFDHMTVCGNAQVSDDAKLNGYGMISNDAVIRDNAHVNNLIIGGKSYIGGDVSLSSRCIICDDARILKASDIMVFNNHFAGPTGLAFYRCADGSVKVSSFKFSGTIDGYINHILKNYKLDRHIKMYTDPIAMAQRYFGLEVTL